MPRNIGQTVENNFTRGLITEATGFNFPENACTETWNTRFNKKGNVTRRLGIDFEDDVTQVPVNATEGVCHSFIWRNVANHGDLNFLVIQAGRYVSFWQPDGDGNFSGGLKAFTIDLEAYKFLGTPPVHYKQASMASGLGKLFICHPYCDPLYIIYDVDTDTITTTQYQIMVRDFEGVEDGLRDDERPTTLTNTHKYNLYNQGWFDDGTPVEHGPAQNPADYIKSRLGYYPSNCDIWFIGKNPIINNDMDAAYWRKAAIGNSLAPKGHFIFNAFQMDRSAIIDIHGLPIPAVAGLGIKSSDGFRPSCIAFFAGRLWYAGVDHKDYGSKVYYTQIIERDKQIGLCHQLNDPTSETFNDLLDTDGGVITIGGLAKTISLFPTKNALLVFSTNGVWSIGGSGAEGTGFVATDFNVANVSSVAISNQASLVNVEGAPFWWNYDGIWTMQVNDAGGIQVVSLTNDTIKQFFQDTIHPVVRGYSQGAYNPLEKTIQWLWKSDVDVSVVNNYKYNRILEYNLNTGAFYPFSWEVTIQPLSSIFCITNLNDTEDNLENVTDNNLVTVTDTLGGAVQTNVQSAALAASSKFKYVAYQFIDAVNAIAFLEEIDESYVDFKALDNIGRDYSSYFTTGAKVHGQGDKNFNVGYITFIFNSNGQEACYVQGRWDWANAASTGRWTTRQQLYNTRMRDLSHRRLLLRGSGPALQLRFESVSGKPFDLVGWTTLEGVDGTP